MQRRRFIQSTLLGSAAVFSGIPLLNASSTTGQQPISKLKITKVRYYSAPGYTKPLFNQARGIVEVMTDGGITGIGEGGARDTVEQCAQMC